MPVTATNCFEIAKKTFREAEKNLLQASINEFPVGCQVEWKHGYYTRVGIVTWHSENLPRVGLRNLLGADLPPKDTIGLTKIRHYQ